MWTPTKYTLVLLAIVFCISQQVFGQTSVEKFGVQVGLRSKSNFETEVHQSILALRNAEATLEDTVAVFQLEEIGYLAIVQSGFSATKKDINQRTGYWMLSYPVAIKYGLIVNNTIDERKLLAKSTKAAYQYWQELKTIYKSEERADFAFIESAIALTKFEKDSTNFMVGNKYITTRKLRLEKVKKIYQKSTIKSIGPDLPTVLVTASKPISFDAIHHFLQIPTTELRRLNPEWTDDLYEPHFGKLKLPLKYKGEFEEEVAAMEQKTRDEHILFAAANTKRLNQLKGDIPDLKSYRPIRYKVKMGDNLGKIAQQHHVKISSIRSWNELKSDRIYVGQKLTIYVSMNQRIEPTKKPPKKAKPSTLKKGDYLEYTVKTGDTLWGISQQFENISADIIMEDNGIDENIAPGQVLKIRQAE